MTLYNMTLLDEVAKIEAGNAEKARQETAERKARHVEEAAERFRRSFEEEPEKVTPISRRYDTGGGRRGEQCYASALIEHEDVRLILTHSQHAELRVLIKCEHCGRDFASHSTVYGYSNRNDHDDPGARASALESLTRALNEHKGRFSDIYDHKCEESTLLHVRVAIRDAANTLKVSEWEIIEKARNEHGT